MQIPIMVAVGEAIRDLGWSAEWEMVGGLDPGLTRCNGITKDRNNYAVVAESGSIFKSRRCIGMVRNPYDADTLTVEVIGRENEQAVESLAAGLRSELADACPDIREVRTLLVQA